MVAKGDIDYAVCDQQIARVSKGNLPEIDIDTDISFTQLQSWAVRKDSPILLDSLNIGFFRALHQYLFIEDDRIGEQIVLFDVAGDRNIAGDYVALVTMVLKMGIAVTFNN